MGALKDRAAVDRIDPLTPLAAIDRHLAALGGAKVAGVGDRRLTMSALQALRMKILRDPFEIADRVE